MVWLEWSVKLRSLTSKLSRDSSSGASDRTHSSLILLAIFWRCLWSMSWQEKFSMVSL
jgi:hypothetical protein